MTWLHCHYNDKFAWTSGNFVLHYFSRFRNLSTVIRFDHILYDRVDTTWGLYFWCAKTDETSFRQPLLPICSGTSNSSVQQATIQNGWWCRGLDSLRVLPERARRHNADHWTPQHFVGILYTRGGQTGTCLINRQLLVHQCFAPGVTLRASEFDLSPCWIFSKSGRTCL
jgi:hypothetical protein